MLFTYVKGCRQVRAALYGEGVELSKETLTKKRKRLPVGVPAVTGGDRL